MKYTFRSQLIFNLIQITVAPLIDINYSKIEKNMYTESKPQPESKQQTESKPQSESKQQTESKQQPESKQLLGSTQQLESKQLSELRHFTTSELNSAVQNLLFTSVTYHEQEISNIKQIMAVSFLFFIYHLVKLNNQVGMGSFHFSLFSLTTKKHLKKDDCF